MFIRFANELLHFLSLIEVNIDYPEYRDIEEANYVLIIKEVTEINEEINKLIKEGRQGQIIKEGIKVALVGAPNVGKSSLLNALLKRRQSYCNEYCRNYAGRC